MARDKKGKFKSGDEWDGNSKGRPDSLPKVIRELTAKQYNDIAQELMCLPTAELEKIIDDPRTPSLTAMMAQVIVKGAKYGDQWKIQFFLDRLIGPVPQKIEQKTETKAEVVYKSEWGLTNEATDGQRIDGSDDKE